MHSLLRMLLVCIRIYLKSVLGYKYLNIGYLSSGHDILEQGREDPLLFFEAKNGQQAKKFGKHCCRGFSLSPRSFTYVRNASA